MSVKFKPTAPASIQSFRGYFALCIVAAFASPMLGSLYVSAISLVVTATYVVIFAAIGPRYKIKLSHIFGIFLAGTIVVGILARSDVAYTRSILIVFLGPIFLFIFMSLRPLTLPSWRAVGLSYVAGALVVSCLIIYNWRFGVTVAGSSERYSALWLEGNAATYTIATSIAVLLSCLLSWTKTSAAWFIGSMLVVAVSLFAIVLSGSRGAVLSVAGVLLIFFLMSATSRYSVLAIPLAFLVLCLGLLSADQLLVGAFDRFQVGGGQTYDEITSGRLSQYPLALDLIEEKPFSGHGPELFEQLAGIPLHNALLSITVDYGVPALVAYVMIFILIFARLICAVSRITRVIGWMFLLGWLPILLTGVWGFAPQLWLGLAWLCQLACHQEPASARSHGRRLTGPPYD